MASRPGATDTGNPPYASAVRAITRQKVSTYTERPDLSALGDIEITSAAPAYATALQKAIEASGGSARCVTTPSGAGICLFTEGLTGGAPASRHANLLQAILSARDGVHCCVLDFSRSETLSDIGGFAGLCRSVRIERPGMRAHAFSSEKEPDLSTYASRVTQALPLPDNDYKLDINGIWRDVPGPELLPPSSTIRTGSQPVWLVTGGARGVTASCAIELARRTAGSFLLLGRSAPIPWPDWLEPVTDLKTLRGLLARNSSRPEIPRTPKEIDQLARRLMAGSEIASTLAAIEAAGATARYVQADIGNSTHLQSVLDQLQQETGTITGLVHGAGVLSDGRSETLSEKAFETVFAPKVLGLASLLDSLDVQQLSHIGLFSSASAVFGNEGQANYAAANEWLNNVAEQLSADFPDTQVKSFCWGPWQGGMVDDALARMFTERGIGLISRQEGARIFADQLLSSPHDWVRFVVGDEWGPQ